MTKELGRPTGVIMFFIVIYCILNTAVQAIICYSTSSVVCSCHMNLQLLATRVSLKKLKLPIFKILANLVLVIDGSLLQLQRKKLN